MSTTLIHAVMAVYHELDEAIDRLREHTGLACRTSCGACCLSPKVQATPLEALPLAAELARQAPIEHWLELLDLAGDRCALYRPAPDDPTSGRCGVYFSRPLLCRLFGFAARRNKYGQPELAACHIMKADQPGLMAEIAQQVNEEPGLAPIFSNWSSRVAGISPQLSDRLLPINEAIAEALTWIGLQQQIGGLDMLPHATATDHEPPTPSRAA